MKKFLWIFSSALLLSVAVLSTGCGEDDPIVKNPPSIEVGLPTPASVVEEAGSTVTFTVTASKGTDGADLSAITVYEGSTKLDFGTQVTVDDPSVVANPWTVDNAETVTYDVTVLVEAAAGEAVYTVEISDKDGKTASADVTVTVETKIEKNIEGASINLYNQGGPIKTGGIDLDNGESTGTSLHSSGENSYLQAELRDMGLDLTQVNNPELNWHQRIGGINGTEVRQIDGGLSSSEFGDVGSKEAIKELYNSGIEFSENIPNYDFKVSAKVNVGDAFVVYKSATDTYYLVVVNAIVVTPDLQDNDDHYNVSIKF